MAWSLPASVYLGFLALDVGWHETYVRWGHYVAAVPLSGAGLRCREQRAAVRRRPDRHERGRSVRLALRAISLRMIAALLVAAVYFARHPSDRRGRWEYWVFAVELALLVPFAAFWMLQTQQWWRDGAPGL